MLIRIFNLQEPEPIDWDYYRKGIGPRLVDMYKEHYESMFVNSMVNALIVLYILDLLMIPVLGCMLPYVLSGDVMVEFKVCIFNSCHLTCYLV